jgi:ABC-2 type transport system permease protein
MCFLPSIYIFLFGYMYSPRVVNDIDTIVLDYAQTATSRMIIQGFADSERFKINEQVRSEEELQKMMDSRQTVAAIVIPGDLERNLLRGKGSEVLIIVNGTNMLFSNAVASSANEIVSTISTGISMKTLGAKEGIPAEETLGQAMPLSYRTKIWYNPTFNYLNSFCWD